FSRKDGNAALLSNYEVYKLLTDLKQQRRETGRSKQSAGQQNLNTIMYETLKYISKTPCKFQNPEVVRDFLLALKSHKLTKAEKLQLLNLRPVTAVEIQLVSCECCHKVTSDVMTSWTTVNEPRSWTHLCCLNGIEGKMGWEPAEDR
uniref:DNA-directed RNA polymerase III subunit RPC9 n=1 Tax=Podarcis muralis TaxID=64176 RepID=A0A670K325_PODMU